jgi:hypothetical protein
MARALLKFNADMTPKNPSFTRTFNTSRTVRACCGAVARAALLIVITGHIGEAQQIDRSSTAAALTPAAQSSAEQTQLSMKACGAAVTSAEMPIVFFDEHHSLWYRITNKGLHLTSSRHLQVIGGLLPTWNLAAQAGATDPGPTLTAVQWTLPNQQIGSSPYSPPKLRVTWMPTLHSPCPTP